jgi:hypothetical protein
MTFRLLTASTARGAPLYKVRSLDNICSRTYVWPPDATGILVMAEVDITPEFQQRWDAALFAARRWHEAQASRTMIQARRSRFPKNLEREAEVHTRSAELIVILSPSDV